MSISTKNGDNGDTSLFDGTRIGKNSTTIEAIGISDELNAFIGFIQSKKYRAEFEKIQNELFVVGSDIATPLRTTHEHRTKRIEERLYYINPPNDQSSAAPTVPQARSVPPGTAC